MTSKTILSYKGPFYIELISVFGTNIRNFKDNYVNARKKLFKIFIELSQNVSNYSENFHIVNNVQRIGVGELILKELETASGRNRSNLSRTLKTMSRYGIVELVKQKRTVKPVVKATDFKVEFGLDKSFAPQQ